jgi:hypothetical protein
MRFDLMTGGLPLARMRELARDAHAAGFDGLVVTESGRTAYLGCAAAALAAPIAAAPHVVARTDRRTRPADRHRRSEPVDAGVAAAVRSA